MSEENIICQAQHRVGDIAFAMERGDLSVVKYLLSRDGRVAYTDIVPEDDLTSWLKRAEMHEAIHGMASFLVASHRFNIELRPILNRQAAGDLLSADDLPSSRWSMHRGWHNPQIQ